jgi:hypothetical protein
VVGVALSRRGAAHRRIDGDVRSDLRYRPSVWVAQVARPSLFR